MLWFTLLLLLDDLKQCVSHTKGTATCNIVATQVDKNARLSS